ncbi:MAG: polysaccharide deacetylase [Caulobacteraceae bacterium]|nr:polysaccharide deacetylase [Caulobacteraceae bacterium]
MTELSPRIVNGLSVDVEEHFQVQALSSAFPPSRWQACESRVEANTERLLEIFSEAQVKATFFTLGWVAERHPQLVRRIVADGHEIASHGYRHERVDSQTPEAFRADVGTTRRLLEDLGGVAVRGYRAPTFSVGPHTPWAWRILEEEGYTYSSSIYPVLRDNYGVPSAPRGVHRPEGAHSLVEIPIATVRFAGRNWPSGGGGYFRLLPYQLSRAAIRRINQVDRMPAAFYIHPWEVDPGQPRVTSAPLKSRLRHYINLEKTGPRLTRLAHAFLWDRMDRAFGLAGAHEPARATMWKS